MYFLILFLFIVICFFSTKTYPAKIIIFLFTISIASGVLLQEFLDLYSVEVVIYTLFVCFFLYPIFLSFNYFNENRVGFNVLSYKSLFVIKIALFFSIVGVFVNFYIVYKMFGFYISSDAEIEVFKNAGLGLSYLDTLSNFAKVTAALLTPLSYIFLPLHFYFLVNRKYYLSFFSFFASLSIILEQLVMFGRGGMVAFFFLYIFFLSMVYGKLNSRFKKVYKLVLIFALMFFAGIFLYIAFDRFDNDKHFIAKGIVTNPVLISFLSYYSQWFNNGYEIFTSFTYDKIIFMSNFSYLPSRLMEVFGAEKYDLGKLRMDVMGFQSTYFNGLPALLLYDLHFIGTLIFSLFFYILTRFLLGVKRIYNWDDYVLIGFLIVIAVFFFQGPIFVFASYNFALIFFVLIKFFSLVSLKKKPV